MKKIDGDALKMHNFFEKYRVPLSERIEILDILKSGDELFVCVPMQKGFSTEKEKYLYLLKEKLGPIEFSFEAE